MQHIRGNQIGLADLLKAFPSCKPPLSLLIEHLPRLLPRPYSISSRRAHPTLSFVYTVVETPRPGLATSWLAALQPGPGTEIRLFPRQGRNFRPPALSDYLIMVCAGSGIGPFYGFLRYWEEERKVYKGPLGEAWLIFGCRSRQYDYLYEEELKELSDSGVLSRLTVCFSRDRQTSLGSAGDATVDGRSRDEPNDKQTDDVEAAAAATEGSRGDAAKINGSCISGGKYVQHGMEEAGAELAAWILEKGARFYVCGDAANMGRAVHEALVRVLGDHSGGRLGSEGAPQYVARMVEEKRYLQDVWT